MYNTLSWPSDQTSDQNIEKFAEFYVDERYKKGDTAITVKNLLEELKIHAPYVILEHMVFAISYGFANDDYYMANLRKRYKAVAKKLNRKIVYSNSPRALVSVYIIIVITLFN